MKKLLVDQILNVNPSFANWIDPCIMSNSISIHRNLSGHNFVHRSSIDDNREVCSKIMGILQSNSFFDDYMFEYLSEINPYLINVLYEEKLFHFYSSDYVNNLKILKNSGTVVIINQTKDILIEINNIDHLTVTAFSNKNNLSELYHTAIDVVNNITTNYAYNDKNKFLTSNVDLHGIGMSYSGLLHLPGIAIHSAFQDVNSKLQSFNYNIAGFFGYKSDFINDFYTFNSIASYLYKNADSFLSIFEEATYIIMELEKYYRENIEDYVKKDLIYKAYGLSKYGYNTSFFDACSSLSCLKWGIDEDIIKNVSKENLAKSFVNCFPAHVQFISSCDLDEIDKYRASLIRKGMKK